MIIRAIGHSGSWQKKLGIIVSNIADNALHSRHQELKPHITSPICNNKQNTPNRIFRQNILAKIIREDLFFRVLT